MDRAVEDNLKDRKPMKNTHCCKETPAIVKIKRHHFSSNQKLASTQALDQHLWKIKNSKNEFDMLKFVNFLSQFWG